MPEFTPFGNVFEPIGYINGKPVWPVLGGAPEDGENDGTEEDADAEDGQSADTDGSDSDDGTDDSGQSAGESSEKPVSRAEFDALTRRLSAADKKRVEAEKRAKAFEDRDKTELQKLQDENETLRKRDSERDEAMRGVQLRDAFRDASDAKKITWHNSALALKELNRDAITIEDDGKVKGMDAAVKALSEAHPYLVVTETAGSGSSGGSFNNKNGGGSGKIPKDKLANKYAALRGRGGNQ